MRLTTVALLLLVAGSAGAQERRLEVNLAADGAITAGAAGLWIALSSVEAAAAEYPAAGARRPGGLDGYASFRLDEGVAGLSDIILYSTLGTGLAAAAADGYHDDQLGGRLVLYGEALAVNALITDSVKRAVRRPRPFTYTSRRGEADDTYSFFSGHASWTACASFTTARSLDLSGDLGRAERVGLYTGAGLLTLIVSGLRIGAGMHFPTDVLTGAVVGTTVGLAVPQLHRKGGLVFSGGPAGEGGTQLAMSSTF